MSDRLCAKCGAPVYASEAEQPARLCAKHLQEAIANTSPFADGKDAGSTPKCVCDGPCPECPSGKPRKSCPICEGYGTLCCEFPCWQRVGLTSESCCPGCPPLPDPEPEPVASVTALPFRDQNVAGVPAASEITARSWDAKAAGRRAVEKHGDALERLSDEETEASA